jgi:AMP-binding enzyme
VIVTNDRNAALARDLARESVKIISPTIISPTIMSIDRLGDRLSAENLGLAIPPCAIAYILYTSGSTGKPKGVVQSNRNVLHNIMKYTNGVHLDAVLRLAAAGAGRPASGATHGEFARRLLRARDAAARAVLPGRLIVGRYRGVRDGATAGARRRGGRPAGAVRHARAGISNATPQRARAISLVPPARQSFSATAGAPMVRDAPRDVLALGAAPGDPLAQASAAAIAVASERQRPSRKDGALPISA